MKNQSDFDPDEWARERGHAAKPPNPWPHIPTRKELLTQARLDVEHALNSINRGDWLHADIFLKLAIDQIRDAGVLP